MSQTQYPIELTQPTMCTQNIGIIKRKKSYYMSCARLDRAGGRAVCVCVCVKVWLSCDFHMSVFMYSALCLYVVGIYDDVHVNASSRQIAKRSVCLEKYLGKIAVAEA